MFDLKPGSNILAIGAHPDDIEFGCVGTLLYLKEKFNCKIHYLICTYGELSSSKDVRKTEEDRAMKLVGVESIHFLCGKG